MLGLPMNSMMALLTSVGWVHGVPCGGPSA